MVAQFKFFYRLKNGRAAINGRAVIFNSHTVVYISRAAIIFVVILKILSNYSKFTGMGRIFVCLEYEGE